MAALIWLVPFYLSLRRLKCKRDSGILSTSILALSVILDILLIAIVVMAHPEIRRRIYNSFELVHRGARWLVVILF